jgi:hypothetical protein
MMRIVVVLGILLAMSGCEKTIHEASVNKPIPAACGFAKVVA